MASKKKTAKRRQKNSKGAGREVRVSLVIAAVALCLTAAVLLSVLSVLNRHPVAQQVYDFGKERAEGIDVSEHNGSIDWNGLSDQIDFAFIRVGYRTYSNGDIYEDKKARDNMKACEAAGIPYGVYFYSQAVDEKEAQEEAAFVRSVIRRYHPDLPLVIDFEYATDESGAHVGRLYDANLSRNDATTVVKAFCDEVEENGYLSGVYASSSVLAHKLNLRHLSKDTLIWAADYNSGVTYAVDYTVWQYSKSGSYDEIASTYVDLDYWYS